MAETVNLLDDGLSIVRAREAGEISEAMIARFVRFGRYGYDQGAAGILATCSALGPAIERLAAAVPVPVLKPTDAHRPFRHVGAGSGRWGRKTRRSRGALR